MTDKDKRIATVLNAADSKQALKRGIEADRKYALAVKQGVDDALRYRRIRQLCDNLQTYRSRAEQLRTHFRDQREFQRFVDEHDEITKTGYKLKNVEVLGVRKKAEELLPKIRAESADALAAIEHDQKWYGELIELLKGFRLQHLLSTCNEARAKKKFPDKLQSFDWEKFSIELLAVSDEATILTHDPETRRTKNLSPRPKKTTNRRPSETLFKSALQKHHKYESDGSVMNFEPASTRDLEKLVEGLSDTTAGRLLVKHFGSIPKYKDACRSKNIGQKLIVLMGDALHVFGSCDPSRLDAKGTNNHDSDE